MNKIITPVTFQNKVRDLSEVLPLSIGDEVKQVLSNPVCDRQPADSGPPAIGGSLSCNKQGGVLCNNYIMYENQENYGRAIIWPKSTTVITFSQPVRYFTLFTEIFCPVDEIYWRTPTGAIIKVFPKNIRHNVWFEGTSFRLYNNHSFIESTAWIRGFY